MDQAIEVCDGDIRLVLRSALDANSFLLVEIEHLMLLYRLALRWTIPNEVQARC